MGLIDRWLRREERVALRVIGRVHSPFTQAPGTPIQPAFADGAEGRAVLRPEYAAALDDIEGFDRVWLVYLLDRADGFRPHVVPYRDTRQHGVLATRAPPRPNPVGLSAVRLVRREGAVLHLRDVDLLDGTPLLDVKPYIPRYDAFPEARAGWMEDTTSDRTRADDRFHRTPRSP